VSWGKFIRADITPQSKVVYLYLEEFMARHKRVYCRQATMAKDLKLSKRTIARCIKELDDAKMISRKRLRSSCDYFVHLGLLHPEMQNLSYINKPLITRISKTSISKNIKQTKLSAVTSHLGKNLSLPYRDAVKAIKSGKRLRKSDQLLKDKFFVEMKSKGNQEEFWKKLIEGEIQWPKELPKLGKQ